MDSYYVNKNAQPTGEHEVHEESCSDLPEAKNRIHLGYFSTCRDAVIAAGGRYLNVDGCKRCIPDCHTR